MPRPPCARPLRLGCALLLTSALALGCAKRERPAGGPHPRVVTLTPSSTELVAAVGALDNLVGVDQFSSYPPQVVSLPKVGDYMTPNVEAILSLGSDIVVLDATQTAAAKALESSGVNTLSLAMMTIDDVRLGLVRVGAAVGREKEADAAVAQLDRDLAEVEERARDAYQRAGARPRVLVVVDRRLGTLGGIVVAGPDTYLDELITRAGAVNAFGDSPIPYAQVPVEEIIARAPDVILDAVHVADSAKALEDWRELTSVPAVANGRVRILGDTIFVTPGPRLGEALRRLVPLIWEP